MNIVICGLSISSSWGNGHATTYRGLVSSLASLGHHVLFLERDVPWYASNRDLPSPDYCDLRLYNFVEQLEDCFSSAIADADAVIIGSYVPQGVAVGNWALEGARCPVAFYDIDTPITLAKLERGDYEYISPQQIPRYDLYLSFTGGRILRVLESAYGSPLARPLYCGVDTSRHRPVAAERRWRMGYLGTYSTDRQPKLEELMLQPARALPDSSFALAGPQYPPDIDWPDNLERIDHLPPDRHCEFYCAQDLTLNVTRSEMVRMGFCPSVRLFEAAACGTAILSDFWTGLETFFKPGEEILIARDAKEALSQIADLTPAQLDRIGQAARRRALAAHTATHRAVELIRMITAVQNSAARKRGKQKGIVVRE